MQPDGPVRAKLAVLHGFSDHINRYYEFFPSLAERGIAVYGFDQRGWGRSVKTSSDKGRTGPTATVLADIAAFVKPLLGKEGDADAPPVFVLGHSMGGNEVATLMAAPAGSELETTVVRRVRGWLFESPFFGWPAGEEPSALKISTGRLAGRFLPHFQLKHHIPLEYMSRDAAVVADLRQDKLLHDTGTLEGLAALLDRVNDLAQGRCRPGAGVQSVWLGHGDADRCTSFDASKAWFDTAAADVPDKTFRNYVGHLHQLHAEPKADRDVFFRECADWILARAGGGEAVADKAGEEASAAAATAEAKEAALAAAETTPASAAGAKL